MVNNDDTPAPGGVAPPPGGPGPSTHGTGHPTGAASSAEPTTPAQQPPPGTSPPRAPGYTPPGPARTSWFARHKILTGLGILIVLIVVIAVATSHPTPSKTNAATSGAAQSTAAASSGLVTTAATGSTPESAAATEASTEPATPAQTPIASPRSYSGQGDSVVHITKPVSGPVLLTATYQGGANNFVVEALGPDLSSTDVLINTIGAYHGTVLLDGPNSFSQDTTALKVTATGPWSITLADPRTARSFDTTISGKGDEVVNYTGGPAAFLITNQGQDNFAVTALGGDFPDLLVNTIGNYHGTVPISASGLVQIESDGSWTMTKQ